MADKTQIDMKQIIEDLNAKYLTPQYQAEKRQQILEHPPLITIFGGTSLIGTALSKRLTKLGYRLRLVSRHAKTKFALKQIGNFDQIQIIDANVNNTDLIDKLLSHTNYIIYDIALTHDKDAIIHIAKQANELNIPLIFFSSLAKNSIEREIEDLINSYHKRAIAIRPSIMFGANDNIFNAIAKIMRFTCIIPVYDTANLVQPVYVEDVANFVAWLFNSEFIDRINFPTHFELGGPDKLNILQILDIIAKNTGRNIKTIKLPKCFALSKIRCSCSRKRNTILIQENIVSPLALNQGLDFTAAHITPQSFLNISKSYMWQYRKAGQFTPNMSNDWVR